MIERDVLSQYVREVFARLDDPSFLAGHPLALLLAEGSRSLSPDSLRRVVVGSIELVRPPKGTAVTAASWRRWRALGMRYVDGASTDRIARELGVCDRQARRDLLAGTNAVAAAFSVNLKPAKDVVQTPVSLDEDSFDRDARSRELAMESARLTAASSGETSDLVAVLESALATTGHLAETRRAQYRTVIPDGLLRVGCGEALLRQTLLCLLSLALDWGTEPQIEISAAGGPDAIDLRLLVASSAQGPDTVSNAETGEAASLLDAARNLIGSLGGTVDLVILEGNLDVRLRLPTAREVTVLVVDDNPDVVDLFRRYLAGASYRLLQARTPRAALELARTGRPDVITLDVMLPSQDGWQVLAELRGDPRTADVPVIVCSVLPERRLAESLGVAEFLAKPISPRSLREAIGRCLARSAVANRG